MNVQESKDKLFVRSFDIKETKSNFKKHGNLFPDNIRANVCGNSNCGKTSLILSLINEINGLSFLNVYIFSKTLDQPKYLFLKQVFDKVPEIGFKMYSEMEQVPEPEDAKKHSIMIFDDLSYKDQSIAKSYFTRGRHFNICCFFLTQSYCNLDKHSIRENTNMLILFKQDLKNLRHIWEETSSGDMTFNNFVNIANECFSKQYGFLLIDKTRDISNGRYRCGFHSFITI